MTHRRRRVSRALLAVLTVIIAVGLFTYVRRARKPHDNKQTLAAATTAPSGAGETASASATQPATQPAGTTEQKAESVALLAQHQPTAKPGPLVTETPTAPVGSGATPTVTPVAPTTLPAKAEAFVAAAPAAPPQKVEVRPAPPAVPLAASAPSPSGSTATVAVGVVERGRAKMQAGNLLEARDMVNGALAAGQLSATDSVAARQLLSEINQVVVFSPRRFADDKWGGSYSVQPGDRLDRIGAKFGLTPALIMRLNNISDARRLRAGATIKVLKGPFHAVVSKSEFRLDLYLGAPAGNESVYVTSFPVGLGKDDSTPIGKWLVEPEKKIKNPVYYSPRGEGIIAADDPKNPLGDYWIGLAGTDGDAVGKLSYGIHGTIEPDSIGKQASMGCVRMRNEDVARVFEALAEGKSTVLVRN